MSALSGWGAHSGTGTFSGRHLQWPAIWPPSMCTISPVM